ncbi:MAG TPA: tRNA pseudouridine(55) synthase TruB [Candidatus Eremiobacteraceae bacterium]
MPGTSVPFGFINANKPAGITSTAFGSRVRRALGRIPLGHWGTLDPDAKGVLVLAVGHATKLLPLLGDGRKKYEFDLVLGAATDTADASGAVTHSSALPAGWRDAFPETIAGLVGPLSQVPPMYSAVKVGGQPLYKSARRGEEVARPARTVEIYSLRVLEYGHSGARLAVECSAGTYIRTLCEEIGSLLGIPAHMDSLVRTAAGPFVLADACAQEALLADPFSYLIDPLEVLTQPRISLNPDDAHQFGHGNVVIVADESVAGDVLVTSNGRISGTAVATAQSTGTRLQPARVFT